MRPTVRSRRVDLSERRETWRAPAFAVNIQIILEALAQFHNQNNYLSQIKITFLSPHTSQVFD